MAMAIAVLLAVWAGAASATTVPVYMEDFEGAVGAEWSNTSTDTAPADPTKFLGQFGNQTVSLSLASLPAHSEVTVSFELFIIHSWDGHANGSGPDVWDLTVSGGPTLLNTTFATHAPRLQAYPSPYPGNPGPPHNPPHPGATCANCLGLPNFFSTGDRYNLSFTFPHSGNSLQLDFAASGLQSLSDESWGLDNVKVEAKLAVDSDVVDIDIKPGSDPNSVNTKSRGVIPVAILGSATFDVTDVDVTTLMFGPCGSEVALPAHDLTDPHLQDVNSDGLTDLVSHYRQKDTGLSLGDTEACLVGATTGGISISGMDAVNIVK